MDVENGKGCSYYGNRYKFSIRHIFTVTKCNLKNKKNKQFKNRPFPQFGLCIQV